jgi:hypothetical protein
MSLNCYCDADYQDYDWWWYPPAANEEFTALNTKRSRNCISCKQRITPGGLCIEVKREKAAASYVEECIYGDTVPLASWYLCEACGGLALALAELHMCYTLGPNEDSLKQQIAEWRELQTELKPVLEEMGL